MVSTAHPGATAAGVEALEAGGNAFDAAIAAALAIGVCEPHASGLGGQTMVLFHDAATRRTVALDGSSRAPERAVPGILPDEQKVLGHRATTVPSTPATLHHLLQAHATLPLPELMEPAIRLAEDGYIVSPLQHNIQVRSQAALRKAGGARFFLDDGRPFAAGDRHRQPVLAGTLGHLAEHGLMDFYDGTVADAIARDMEEHGGLITMRDLAHVPHPIERRPDMGRWRGRRVASFPPPGAGRVLLEILHIMDRLPRHLLDPEKPHGAVAWARVIEQALRDHHGEPRDPARHQMTAHKMVAADHAAGLARTIRVDLPGETTHVSVLDREGNAVALTQSIELFYGACAASEELGFLYNNYLSAFADTTDLGHPYALRPNGVPWSSVAPAIVFSRRRPVLVAGSPGSDRIASAVAQVLVRLERQQPLDAVAAPRIHARPHPRKATLESPRFRPGVLKALREDGYAVDDEDAYSLFHGSVHLAMRTRGGFVGVADPRRDGSAGGPDMLRPPRPRRSRRGL